MLLNKLLNEMDGLREDAEVIFILTTNSPDELEPALASRPGRIDQAIEFPLPDDIGRAKLARLYGRGLELDDDIVGTIVSKSKGVSPAPAASLAPNAVMLRKRPPQGWRQKLRPLR
jgi:ATP-dependent 26S proteasome regulatory subunit